MSGVRPEDLAESDLLRELQTLHETRHGTFLHGSPDALAEHTSRTAELENKIFAAIPTSVTWTRARTRAGARGSTGFLITVGGPDAGVRRATHH